MKRLISGIIRNPLSIIVLVLAITGIFILNISNNMKFSTDFEKFFPRNSEKYNVYQGFKEAFLLENSGWFVAVQTEDSAISSPVLSQIVRTTKAIEELEHVNQARSLANLKGYLRLPFIGNFLTPVVEYSPDSLAFINGEPDPAWLGTFLAKDGMGYSINVTTDHDLSSREVKELSRQIDSIMLKEGVYRYHVTGQLLAQLHLTETMKEELALHLVLAIVLVLLVLWWIYRSIWGLVRFVFTLIIAIIWVLGFMVLFGKDIDVVSSIIPSIIFILGTSDLIHLNEAYLHHTGDFQNKENAILMAIKRVGKATVYTSLTTGIGFLSLSVSSVPTIRELGLYVALGVFLTLILSYTFFIALLVISPKPTTRKIGVFEKLLVRCWTLLKHRRSIIAVTLVLIIAGSLSSLQLKTDNYVTEELPINNDYNQSYRYIEEQFAGSRTIDVVVHIKDSSLYSDEGTFDVLTQLFLLDSMIRYRYNTPLTIGILDHYYLFSNGVRNDKTTGRTAPDREMFRQVKKEFMSSLYSSASKPFIDSTLSFTRISGLSVDKGGALCRQIDDEILQYANNNLSVLEVDITGLSHMIDDVNKQIVRDMIIALITAIFIVSLFVAISFWSVKMSLVLLIPNIIPLLMTASLMYILNIDLKISSILIFTIAFGIAVDDSIHFLSGYKELVLSGLSSSDALEEAFFHTGRSIVLTTFILLIGFVSLSFSELASTYYMGILVSCTLLFAVVADLILLPVLVRYLKKS